MNTPSASPGERSPVLVWDAPVRVCHWLMVLSFAGAYLSAESERWALVHITLGYTMAGLVLFRLVWGVLGTRHARFADFVRGPRAVAAYIGSLLRGRPEHHVGHNPAGAVAIVALLALTCVTAVSGWAVYAEVAGDWVGELHEAVANLMLTLVVVHVAGVVVSSRLHQENLVRSMFNGRKPGAPSDGIRRAWHLLAALMLGAVLAFWWLQWRSAPTAADHTKVAVASALASTLASATPAKAGDSD